MQQEKDYLEPGENRQKTIVQVRLFGRGMIELGEERWRLKRKSLGVFVYLAQQQGPVERKTLATLFWPHSQIRKGLNSLTMLLNRLPLPVKRVFNHRESEPNL